MPRPVSQWPRVAAAALMVLAVVAATLTLVRIVRPATSPEAVVQLDPITTLEKRAYEEFRAKKFAAALATCEEIIGYDFKNGRALFIRGLCYKHLGKIAAARSEFQASASCYPPDSDSHFIAVAQLKELSGGQ